MGMLSRKAAGIRQSASDAAFEARVLRAAGVLGPLRPDKAIKVGAAFMRWGASPAGGIGIAAIRYPGETALIDERGSLSFEELHRRSNALANAFAEMGISPGEGVGIMCRNHRGFVEATLAAAKLGASSLLLNTMFAGPQLVEVMRREGPKVLIYDEEFSRLLGGIDYGVKRVIGWSEGSAEEATIEGLIAASDDSERKPPPCKPRFVILTSGTTGTPRGARRSSSSDGMLARAGVLERIPYRSRETMMIAVPLFHSWGFGHLELGVSMAMTMVLQRHFDPEETLRALSAHRAQVLVAVPAMIQRILRLPEETLNKYDLSSLRIVALSGSALPGELAIEWMERFGETIYNLYGSTEVAHATIATPEELRAAPATAGRPPRGTAVRLYDDDGVEVSRGEVGRIFVGSDLVFDGYTGGRGKEVVDGLLCTGDVGHFDADGRLFVDGRSDEMIISGGENVFPREVEDLLARHEGVGEVAVIGVADEEFGQRLKVFVVRAETVKVSEEDLKAHVKANLAAYMVPREVEFLAEMPRNASGKVLKRVLEDEPTRRSGASRANRLAAS